MGEWSSNGVLFYTTYTSENTVEHILIKNIDGHMKILWAFGPNFFSASDLLEEWSLNPGMFSPSIPEAIIQELKLQVTLEELKR